MSKIYNRALYIGGEKRKVGTHLVMILNENLTGVLSAYGADVPHDADAGFAPGCLFWKSTGGSTGSTIYVNEGSKTSADFNALAGGGGALGNFSMDDAYDDGSVVAVDSGAVDFAGVHATNNTVIVRATGSGNAIDLVNSGTGKDIDGSSSTWSVTKLGAAVFNVSMTTVAIIGYDAGADGNLTIDAKGSGTISLGATSTGAITLTRATTISSTLTVTGGADANALTITAGDVLVSDGHMLMVQPDNEISIGITAAGTTTTNVLATVANALTSGAGLYISSNNGASFSGNGGFIHLSDGTNPVFRVGRYGATIIAGNAAATATLTLTAGDLVLTSGHIVQTSGNNTMTVGDMLLSDGSVTIIDADNAASLAVTNSTATTASVVTITSASVTTGTLMAFAHSVGVIASGGSVLRITSTATNTSTTTGVLLDLADASVAGTKILGTFGTTTGIGMSLVTAVTTGTALSLTNGTGIITTTGEMLLVTANSATTCTGLVRVSGSGLTDGWVAELTGGGVNFSATGGMVNLQMGAATVGTGINITTSGIYTGTTGLIDINATQTTTGTIIDILNEGRTTGDIIKVTMNTTGTGNYINFYDGAATDFKVSRYGATTIAGNAAATAALTVSAGDLVLTSGHIVQTSGNFTMTLGNALLTSGNLTLTLGNLVMTSGNLTVVGGITTSSPTGNGLGYATGAGGAVTQTTNRSTGVTLNKLTGTITTDTTSLAAGASAEFTVTNSTVAIGDVIVVSQQSGSAVVAGTAGTLIVTVVTVAAGSFIVSLNNNSSTTAETGAVKINFAVIKAVSA